MHTQLGFSARNHPLQIMGWDKGGPAGYSYGACCRLRRCQVAQISLRVRFRKVDKTGLFHLLAI